MSTYSAMQSNIADKLVRSDLTSQIADEINRSIQFYASQRFYFTETTDTFTTVSGQQSYGSSDGVATDIKKIDMLQITISTNNYLYPQRIDFKELQECNFNNTGGQPTVWAYFQQKIYFYTIPNAAWTTTIYYQKSYTDLSAGSDTNDFTSGLPKDLIEQRTLSVMYSDWIKDDAQAAKAAAREMQIYNQLKIESDRILRSGRITPSEY